MQISRHWRLNANRYRLEGFNTNGVKSVQNRPSVQTTPVVAEQPQVTKTEKQAQPVAA